jgi:hypothetical protein
MNLILLMHYKLYISLISELEIGVTSYIALSFSVRFIFLLDDVRVVQQ